LHKLLNALDIPNWDHLNDGQDLFRVGLDGVLGDDVPQELSPGDSKGAFFGFNLMFNR
jgi:hypothetical protein